MPYELTPSSAMNVLREQLDKSPIVMVGLIGKDSHHEPLTAYFDAELSNSLFFFVRKDNRLVNGMVEGHGGAMAVYEAKSHKLFACLRGQLLATSDSTLLNRFWSKSVEAWFKGGKTDPMLQMLELKLSDVEVWEADLSVAGKLKLAFGGSIEPEDVKDKHVKAAVS